MLSIRPVCLSDSEDSYQWEFDPSTRKWMSDTSVVSYTKHLEWLEEKLKDENFCLLIINDGYFKVGIIRCDVSNCYRKAEIGITLNPNARGKGYSKQCLELGMSFIRENRWQVSVFTSTIKSDNIISQKIFNDVGFEFIEKNNGFHLFKYEV